MHKIVLSGREMKMAECIDFSRDLRLWWKLETLRKLSSIVQKKFNNISIILKFYIALKKKRNYFVENARKKQYNHK